MITLKNVRTPDGKVQTTHLKSSDDIELDCTGLTLLPALIDAHVHFRTPGAEYKENWVTGAQASIAGGTTTVFDMPNNNPSCITKEQLDAKKELIDAQLATAGIPLRYELFLGADQNHLDEIGKLKDQIIGLKIYMGSSTGDLLMTDEAALERAIQIAAMEEIIVAVHAEDEGIIQEKKQAHAGIQDPAVHSHIRDRSAAIKAVKQAIDLTEKYSGQLYILHVSTKEEVDLIRDAKKRELLIYAETTPHHLFLSEDDYQKWGAKVQMNPPLRTKEDQDALWKGIHDGTIDSIGSDHAPHTLEEKAKPYPQSPSGVPGVETTLPLLLNACNEGKISLDQIIMLCRRNIELIYDLEHNSDVVLVNLEKTKEVKDSELKTKCGWSPFSGRILKGWPVYTILKGKVFHV